MSPAKKISLVITSSALAAGLVFLLLFLFSSNGAPELALGGSGDRVAGGGVGLDGAGETAGEAGLTAEAAVEGPDGAASDAETVVDVVESDPLLTGVVSGADGPIEGARVLLFPVQRVEAMIRRLERFDPGSGLPDIPAVIAAVQAELEAFRDAGREARSDAEGVYAYRDIPATGYFVLALADDHVFRFGDVVSLVAGETQVLDMRLERGARIGGRVVDTSGDGIGGARVTAVYRPTGMPGVGRVVAKLLAYVNGEFLRGPFQAETAADGSFTLDSLPPAVYDLVAESAGFPATHLDSVVTGTLEAVIVLAPGARVQGLLVDAAGLPVEGVEVRLVPMRDAVALPFPGAGEMVETVARLLGDRELRAESLANGSFAFRDVGPAPYRLEIEASGYLPIKRPVDVPSGETLVDLGGVRVDRGGVIRGWVRAGGGGGVAGAAISAYPENLSRNSFGGSIRDMVTGRASVKTDDGGAFELAGLAPGTYRLLAQSRGFGGASQNGVATGGEPVELELTPGIALSGVVMERGTEDRLAGVRVGASGVFTTTDEDGRFLLEGITPRDRQLNPFEGPGRGRRGPPRRGGAGDGETGAAQPGGDTVVEVRATAPGYQDASRRIRAGEPLADIVIEIAPRPVIRGVVLDGEGEPLPAALVRLVPGGDFEVPFLDTGLIFVDVSVSDLEGRFTLDAPSESHVLAVLASHPLHASHRSEKFRPSSLGPDDLIEVRLPAGGTVRGTVTDGSAPIAGARVRLSKVHDIDPQARMMMGLLGLPKGGTVTYTNADGEFVYDRIVAADYVLTAEVVGFGDSRTESFTLVDGETKEVHLVMDPGGEITGEVVDQDGLPLAGTRVRVLRETSSELLEAQRFLGGAFRAELADGEGRFVVRGLPSARYTVIAERTGYTSATAAEVTPGSDSLRFELLAAAALDVRVTDAASGMPIARHELRIAQIDEATGEARTGRLGRSFWREVRDGEGRSFRDDLAAGRYRIEARARGYAPASMEVTLRAGETVPAGLALARAGIVRGRVLDGENGQPVPGVRVGLADPDADRGDDGEGNRRAVERYFQEAVLRESVFTGEDGSFVFDTFPPEARTVVFHHDDYVQERRADVAVATGEAIELSVRLARGLSISGVVPAAAEQPDAGYFVLARGATEAVRGVRKGVAPDGNGEFRIAGLAAGSYDIILASRRGGDPAAQRIELEDADATGVVLGGR